MAITAYTGTPGSGKSYALVQDVILPALLAGRRVVGNVAGCSNDRFQAYGGGGKVLGEYVAFEGKDALERAFFPTEDEPEGKTVRGGDLLVFDELRLTFPKRGSLLNPDFEAFLRWHRHLASDGVATDVVLCSQLIGDVHPDIRGLVERSYRFRKLSAVGLSKAYAYSVFEGSEQKTKYRDGNGRFRKEIFDLYKSYDVEGDDVSELKTDKRASAFGKLQWGIAAVTLLAIPLGAWGMVRFLFPEPEGPALGEAIDPAALASAPSVVAAVPQLSSFRIVGYVMGNGEPVVILSDDQGTTRIEPARAFEFRNGRPVKGELDGLQVIARDRIEPQGEFAEEF